MCVADEVHPLQSGKDPLAKFFQTIAEQGHYAGRTVPTNTRQGIYAFAPSGAFLASINTRSPKAMAEMLDRASERYAAMSEAERLGTELPPRAARIEDRFPKDGVIFEVFVRDLPREAADGGRALEAWHKTARNQDQLWWRAPRLERFLPTPIEVGREVEVDPAFVERLATAHLVDHVRGQTPPNPKESIRGTKLFAQVTAIEGSQVHFALRGEIAIEVSGKWVVTDARESENPVRQRGMRGNFHGHGIYDRSALRLEEFTLLALVLRHGATQYNARAHDQDPAPMAFAIRLAAMGTAPIGPAHYWSYREPSE